MQTFLEYIYEYNIINDPIFDLLMKYIHDGEELGFRDMGLSLNWAQPQPPWRARRSPGYKVYLIRVILNLINNIYNLNHRLVANTLILGLYTYMNTL